MDQPLELIVQMDALSLVYRTRRYLLTDGSDWGQLSRLQADLARWLEAESNE